MGFRFRKRIKIANGLSLNISNKGAGISIGPTGAKVSANTSGRKTATVGIPGTGLSYSKSLKKKGKNRD